MYMKKTSWMMAVLLGVAVIPAAQAGQTANHYSCTGSNTNLALTIGMDAEVSVYPVNTELSLSVGGKKSSYSKPQITIVPTAMGNIYQVELPAADGSKLIKHASLIIPTVIVDTAAKDNLKPAGTAFKTKLILTREQVKPDLTLAGVVNPSSYTDLNCRAEVFYW